MARRYPAFAVVLVVGCLCVTAGAGSSTLAKPRRDLAAFRPLKWVPNGPVNGVARFGKRLLIGGFFTRIGRRTGQAAIVPRRAGARLHGRRFPEVAGGPVEAILDDGGGIAVGGRFGWVGGLRRPGLARVSRSNSVDRAFAPALTTGRRDVEPEVRALASSGGILYVGGVFTKIDGVPRAGLAALNSYTGEVLDWNPGPAGGDGPPEINALAREGATVYVAGDFERIGGVPRQGLAAIDQATGAVTDWNPQVNGEVSAIGPKGNLVYLGGSFTNVGGVERHFLTAVDAATGVPTSWSPNPLRPVNALLVDGERVYAGMKEGYFSSRRDTLLATYDRHTGSKMWTANGNGGAFALIRRERTLYVGGSFHLIGGKRRDGAAALNVATGRLSSWAPKPDLFAVFYRGERPAVRALADLGGGVLIGGDFASLGGRRGRSLAAVVPGTGKPVRWRFHLSGGSIGDLTVSRNRLYVVGFFRGIEGRPRNGGAALDRNLRVLPWSPAPVHPYGQGNFVTVLNHKVIVTGGFDGVAGHPGRGTLVAFDPRRGRLLEWGPPRLFGGGAGVVFSTGGRIYAVGQFRTETSTVVLLDPRDGRVTRMLVKNQEQGDIYGAAVLNDRLFLGGAVTRVNGRSVHRLAAVDASTGRLVVWPARADENVFSMTAYKGVIYAAGQFDRVNGKDRVGIAALDPRTGQLLAWNPRLNGSAEIRSAGKGFFAAGDFLSVGGLPQPFLALFR